MELKSLIHTTLWAVADGLGALWVLHTVVGMATGAGIGDALLRLAGGLCG